jgi:hypothetical protein
MATTVLPTAARDDAQIAGRRLAEVLGRVEQVSLLPVSLVLAAQKAAFLRHM